MNESKCRGRLFTLLSVALIGLFACSSHSGQTAHSELAQTWGADEYGMKRYVMALLKTGPNRDLDDTQKQDLQAAHLKNISRMADEGKLVLAGPFLDSGELRGIYIFNVETIEEARSLTNSDPAIQAGSLQMELKSWYGSAALVPVNEWHKKIQSRPVSP